MDTQPWLKAMRDYAAHILREEPMARHTTFGIGGPAEVFFAPPSVEAVVAALAASRASGIPLRVMGNGSNLLVADAGVRGVVMQLGKNLSGCALEGSAPSHTILAQAGVSLAVLAKSAADWGLQGLAFAGGIPGCLGGALCMNAGAYGGQMADVVTHVQVADADGARWIAAADLDFGYRHSRVTELGVAVAARLALVGGERSEILAEMQRLAAARREKQPLQYPSAGSYFKRPSGDYAARLIEESGLKGMAWGGAAVSALHAGFVVNMGGATCADVLALQQLVQQTVQTKFGVWLEPEVAFWD